MLFLMSKQLLFLAMESMWLLAAVMETKILGCFLSARRQDEDVAGSLERTQDSSTVSHFRPMENFLSLEVATAEF